jgi:hypothetical protein
MVGQELERREGQIMAGEIKKWQPPSEAQKIEQALEFIRSKKSTSVLQIQKADVRLAREPRRIDVVRFCALHGLDWAAVYNPQADGSYKYSSQIQITDPLRRAQYAPGSQEIAVLDNRWISEEICAWCGVPGLPFKCNRCNRIVCGGKSTGLYFRCYCGSEGWAERRKFENLGIVPKVL